MSEGAEAALQALLAQVRACTLCAKHLPLGPRPVLRGQATARLLILSQAPGTRVHMTGLSFNDRSGERLREWLGIGRKVFYDERRIAIMPMGFCYPGRDAKGGDLPPRPECAPRWHPRVLQHFPEVELTLLVGSYAIDFYLGRRRKPSMTETVRAWREYLPRHLPLPHPSWRNVGWLKANPWFEAELLPDLRGRTRALLGERFHPETPRSRSSEFFLIEPISTYRFSYG
ncbi:MAG TPA: uracil-DNA glycosylase family protein [Stellaceae bacterium]|nr:uracil-DNA glycosylase family protein [Stellaceae bacterium]